MVAVPVTRNNRIEIDLITPDRCFITGNDFDPTSADILFYQIGELPNDQKNKSRTDIYMACSREGKKLVEVQRNGKMIIDYYGEKWKDFKDETQYPVNPAITFRNYYPLSSFWHPGVNSLVEKDLNADMRLTEYNMGRGYQLPLLITYGLDKPENIINGRASRVNFPPSLMNSSPSANYITPDNKLDILGKLIDDEATRLKLSYKLSKSIITGQTATSGYELMLSKAEILNWNKSQRKHYVKPMTDLIKCIMVIAKKYGFANFKDDHDINIKFGDQKFIETPKEIIERQQKELLAGTKNLVDIEIENSGYSLDRDEALQRVLDRMAENKQLNNTAPEAVFETAKPEV